MDRERERGGGGGGRTGGQRGGRGKEHCMTSTTKKGEIPLLPALQCQC